MKLNKLYDSIRKKYVISYPEEVVRQKLILRMVNNLNYPKSLVTIEKDLCLLPHLQDVDIKNLKRRADIIVFAKNIHPTYLLYPLIMIECKAIKLNKSAIDQVIGYNYHVKAHFVAIANEDNIITLYKKNDSYKEINFLPNYNDLLKSIK